MEFLHSESLSNLAKALSQAQSKIRGAKKDANNPFFKSKYADLESVWEACRGPLTENGLSVAQLPTGQKGLLTILLHSSGEWIAGEMLLNPTKDDPQGLGSALTYGRRYSLAAITGVHQTDDDGNAASGKETPQETEVGPECHDCKRKVTAYTHPTTREAVPLKDVLISSKENWGLNICGGCQIARRKAENKKKEPINPVVDMARDEETGEWLVRGYVTKVTAGVNPPLLLELGNAELHVWHKNSLLPHFKESKGKLIDVVCRESAGKKSIEKVNSIGSQKFVDNKPATDLEATTAV